MWTLSAFLAFNCCFSFSFSFFFAFSFICCFLKLLFLWLVASSCFVSSSRSNHDKNFVPQTPSEWEMLFMPRYFLCISAGNCRKLQAARSAWDPERSQTAQLWNVRVVILERVSPCPGFLCIPRNTWATAFFSSDWLIINFLMAVCNYSQGCSSLGWFLRICKGHKKLYSLPLSLSLLSSVINKPRVELAEANLHFRWKRAARMLSDKVQDDLLSLSLFFTLYTQLSLLHRTSGI